MCTVMPMIASGMKTGSAKGLCNRQDTQRCISGRIGTDGNSVMISRTKQRKKMSEECLKCEYATYDCQSYGACRKRWFLDRLDKDLEKNEAEDTDNDEP